jgi:hypothetical protein
MTPSKIFRRLPILVVVAVSLNGLVACGSDTAEEARRSVSLEFVNSTGENPSAVRSIVDSGQTVEYGTLFFTGPGTLGEEAVTTELLGFFNYVVGAGPAGGYLTVTTGDGDQLVMKLALDATTRTDEVELKGSFDVIAGTGQFEDASGSGTGTGTRSATVGSEVRWTVTLSLAGLDPT